MIKKNALGKGLGALIPSYPAEKEENTAENLKESTKLSTNKQKNVDNIVDTVVELPLSKVEPRADQPRVVFDEAALAELADSIREHGVLQPILVAAVKNHYEIIAGERRWRAAKQAGLKKIPAIVREYTEQKLTEVALIENIQREDLNAIEEAQAYRQLIEEYSLKQEELAKRVSKSRSAIANSLRLLKLDGSVQAMVMNGALSEGHARALLALEDKKQQISAAKEASEKHLSVRDTEKLVKKLLQPAPEKKEDWKEADQSAYDELELSLRKRLGTKVSIRRTDKEKGQVVIDYYSVEDLERLTDLLK